MTQQELETRELRLELETLAELTHKAFGDGDLLTQLINGALEVRDVRSLRMAKAAFDAQPDDIRLQVSNGWKSLQATEGDRQTSRTVDKPLRPLLQVDGFEVWVDGVDYEMNPDADGHCVVGQLRLEPRNCDAAVRIQILAPTDKETVLRLLRKMIGWVEKDWSSLINPDLPTQSTPRPIFEFTRSKLDRALS